MFILLILGIIVAAYVVVSRCFITAVFSGMTGTWRGLHTEESDF